MPTSWTFTLLDFGRAKAISLQISDPYVFDRARFVARMATHGHLALCVRAFAARPGPTRGRLLGGWSGRQWGCAAPLPRFLKKRHLDVGPRSNSEPFTPLALTIR